MLQDPLEGWLGTDPASPDTDDDLLFDGAEHLVWLTDPKRGDGDLDVAYGGYNWLVGYAPDTGSGSFGARLLTNVAALSYARITAADLDNDGFVDLLVARDAGIDDIGWLRGLGDGTFEALEPISSADDVYYASAADLDGDGDLDVVSHSYADDPVVWYTNLGVGTFGAQQIVTDAVPLPFRMHTADLDNDGDPDVLVGSLPNDLMWLENLGGPRSAPRWSSRAPAARTTSAPRTSTRTGNLDPISRIRPRWLGPGTSARGGSRRAR